MLSVQAPPDTGDHDMQPTMPSEGNPGQELHVHQVRTEAQPGEGRESQQTLSSSTWNGEIAWVMAMGGVGMGI